jgi:hypothetical protein
MRLPVLLEADLQAMAEHHVELHPMRILECKKKAKEIDQIPETRAHAPSRLMGHG